MNGYFEQFKNDFKRDVLAQTIVGLRHEKVSNEAAAGLASLVVAATESDDSTTVFERLGALSQSHPEILKAFIKHGNEYDARQSYAKMEEIRGYLDLLVQIGKGGEN